MKTKNQIISTGIVCLMVTAGGSWNAGAQSDKGIVSESGQVYSESRGLETEMDLPADFHAYYGQRINQWRDEERKVAKLDMDGDLNYDGTIDNFDPGDNGGFESTPPGLQLGVGELSKLLIRLSPYRIDFRGEVVITLEVTGINRAVKSGQFESFEEEVSSTGRIRVWKDAAMTELILDSADPEKRFFEWVADDRAYPANLPGIYPRMVYVEGVSTAGSMQPPGKGKGVVTDKGVVRPAYLGDLRLLITVSHRPKGATRETYGEYRKRLFKSFRTSFDHMLLTVREQPQPKEFVNNNAEGVWLKTSAAGN